MGASGDARVAALGIVAVTCTVACGKSEPRATTSGPDDAASTVITSARPADAATVASAWTKPALTREERRAYADHLARGRLLSKDKKWGEAVREFDAAFAIDRGDPRAESELGWAAFNAGDYTEAKRANDLAIHLSQDPKLKAASLYNAGRVAEATGDTKDAERDYEASLALRPNDAVKQALLSLGVRRDEFTAELDTECVQAKTEAALCACMTDEAKRAATDPADAVNASCARATIAGADPGLVFIDVVAPPFNVRHYVASKTDDGVVLGAEIGDVYNPGAFGVTESYTLGAIEPKTARGKKTAWIHAQKTHDDTDQGIDEYESQKTDIVVVCVPGQGVHPCTRPIPVATTYVRDRLHSIADGEIGPETRAAMTPGLPIKRTTTLDVTAEDDGTIRVVLKKGSADDLEDSRVLGSHTLVQ